MLTLIGWVVYCVGYSWLQFDFLTLDPVNGCQSIVFANFPIHRWYFFGWTILTYPVPLSLAIAFNAVAVLRLRAQSHLLAFDKSSDAALANGSTSDTALKRRAAYSLQRAAIALAAIFAITSAPLQAVTAYQCYIGVLCKTRQCTLKL